MSSHNPSSAQEAAHIAARAAAGYTPPHRSSTTIHNPTSHGHNGMHMHSRQVAPPVQPMPSNIMGHGRAPLSHPHGQGGPPGRQHAHPHQHSQHSQRQQHPQQQTHPQYRTGPSAPASSTHTSTSAPPMIPSSSSPSSSSNPPSAVPVMSTSSPESSTAGSSSSTATSTTPSEVASMPTPDASESATEAAVASSSIAIPKVEKEDYLWEMTSGKIRNWLQGAQPLFPKPNIEQNTEQPTKKEEYNQQKNISNALLNNLCVALESASIDKTSTKHNTLNNTDHPAKRMKLESGEAGPTRDVYNILDPSFAKGTDVVHVPGAIIARLTIGGLMNALAGRYGGVVDTNSAKPIEGSDLEKKEDAPIAVGVDATTNAPMTATLALIQNKALGLSHLIAARLEVDMMQSTPKRIVDMLCPELTVVEVVSVRRRIYDTVVLGKGTNASANAEALESKDDLPVAARTGMHDIDKFKKCKVCGNNEQGKFALDKKNGDLICTVCGTVATESLMHEGTQFRKFEGEEDRNHHGDVANPLYSNAYNMGTSLGAVSVNVGAGVGGLGSGGKKGLETILKNIHNYTEMNISQFGKDEKKTRIGYKDKQKKEAFVQMTHVADALSLHQAVLQRAKELFAAFRDDRELVQQFKPVLAACLCEAFDQLSKGGRQILKVKAGNHKTGGTTKEVGKNDMNSRATKRSEMHSSSLAGKGGVFLNTEEKKKEDKLKSSVSTKPPPTKLELQPASTWNLDDTRSWLLHASKNIAKQWHDLQKEETKPGSKIKPGSIPKGSLAEMEGMLVSHTQTLCVVLEKELASTSRGGSGFNKQRVRTPRVNEMGKLGIKWQHRHERGSGGAGGIGNNAMRDRQQNGSKKTAGQILILKTAKALSFTLKDPISGEAIHRELRFLLSQQDARKKQDMRDVASSHRLNQMKRKPWIQARLTQM